MPFPPMPHWLSRAWRFPSRSRLAWPALRLAARLFRFVLLAAWFAQPAWPVARPAAGPPFFARLVFWLARPDPPTPPAPGHL